MRTHPIERRRITAGLLAGTLLLAACGGGDEGTDADDSGDALPQVDEPTDSPVDVAQSDGAAEVPETDAVEEVTETADPVESDTVAETEAALPVQASGFVDLVGADVTAASDVESNPLPSVVVDDLGKDRKVNFRNLVPQEKPILLWMWAPH